jgi:Tol biopolymer transport system component
LCPAFSPDGRSLAFGQVDQSGAATTTAVVVASVNGDGDVSEAFRVDVGAVPPCPVWSPTGDRIAFGVPQTSVINPTQSAAGSEVWILTVADRSITVLPDLLATDLEFSPDGSVLGIASGMEYDGNYGEALADNEIHLYDLASGTMRILEGTRSRAGTFTWSPDGGRIAYQGPGGLRLVDLATEEERALSAPYGTLHGIGPVWSPDGESIVYQRSIGGERHDVVLVWPDDLSADDTPREQVVPLFDRSADGS